MLNKTPDTYKMPDKIEHALLDPKWKSGLCELDGAKHIFLIIEHPTHGAIASLLPVAEAQKLATSLMNSSSVMTSNTSTNARPKPPSD
jgi:hypothetical protein